MSIKQMAREYAERYWGGADKFYGEINQTVIDYEVGYAQGQRDLVEAAEKESQELDGRDEAPVIDGECYFCVPFKFVEIDDLKKLAGVE